MTQPIPENPSTPTPAPPPEVPPAPQVSLASIFQVDDIDPKQLEALTENDIPIQPDPPAEEETPGHSPSSGLPEQQPGIPPFLKDQLLGVMITKLGETLASIDVIGDIFTKAWGTHGELKKFLSPQLAPEEIYRIPLNKHEINSEHNPVIEPRFKQQSLGTFAFNIALNLCLEGVILEVQAGRLRRLHIGKCIGSGSLSYNGTTLIELPEKAVKALKGTFNFGQSLLGTAKGHSGPH